MFLIRLSLNKYSLACRVTSRYVLYDTYSEPYYRKFTHIQAYLRPIQTNSATFWHIQSLAIFRILAYLEPEIYSELCQGVFWHIQNAV